MNFNSLWLVRHGDLIKELTINDLKIKYHNTYLGLVWSLLSPLLLLAVLYYIFFNYRHLGANSAQYLLVGILTWRFFTSATSSSVAVIKQNYGILSNIALPSEIFVLTKNLSALISFTMEMIVLIPLVALLSGAISPTAVLFPLVHILFLMMTFGLSLMLAALYPYFRDLAEVWPFLVQIGFFLCPIIYQPTMIPESVRGYYMLNPVTQIMVMYRDLIISGILPSPESIIYVIFISAFLIIAGFYIFKKLERGFVEVI